MKFEAVLFEVMRAVTISCKLTWPGLTDTLDEVSVIYAKAARLRKSINLSILNA